MHYCVFPSSAPSSAPINVQGYNTSSTDLKVTWQAPSNVDKNGVIIGYIVYYQAVSGGYTDGTLRTKTRTM